MAVDPRRHRNERIVAASAIVLLAAIAAGVVWWSRSITEELGRDQRYIPRQVAVTPEVEMLQEYVRIDTSTPAGVAEGARWLIAQLRARGVTAELIESTPGRFNVYARVRGRERGEGLILFNHIDVVPPGDVQWTHPPFSGKVVGDQLWGRGAVDMKAMAICQLLAFADVARGDVPAHDLVFLATADEETGSAHGMQWLLEHRPDIFEGIRYGITEGGITEIMATRMTYFGIETGGKQLVELTLEAADVEALRRARIALEPYMFPREPQRLLPEVRRYLKTIAPTRMAFKPYLADIDRTIATGEFWRLPAPYRDLLQNTLYVKAPAKDGDGWSMLVRQVNLPDEIPERRIEWLETEVAAYGVRVGKVLSKQGPVPLSSDQTPLFELLASEARQRYGVPAGPQILYRSATDSRFLRRQGIVCYGVSPYPVTFFQSNAIHGRDERIHVHAFLEGIGYMRNVVGKWSEGL